MVTVSLTHRGYRREQNEDHHLLREMDGGAHLLVVADGMGGEIAGGMASQLAVESVGKCRPPNSDISRYLGDLIMEAHDAIQQTVHQRPELQGMGTTMVLAYLRKPFLHWAHVGDSRLYLFRDENLVRITQDHTIPGQLLENGEITEQEAKEHPMRNMLLRCVGCRLCEPDTGSFAVKPTDIILLCSDGLYGEVPPYTIASILGSARSLEERFQDLVETALAAGGSDNITVAGIQI